MREQLRSAYVILKRLCQPNAHDFEVRFCCDANISTNGTRHRRSIIAYWFSIKKYSVYSCDRKVWPSATNNIFQALFNR